MGDTFEEVEHEDERNVVTADLTKAQLKWYKKIYEKYVSTEDKYFNIYKHPHDFFTSMHDSEYGNFDTQHDSKPDMDEMINESSEQDHMFSVIRYRRLGVPSK